MHLVKISDDIQMSFSLARLNYIDLIRGFVAVGRRMSITMAAKDLCLSQSALSRQIRTLEQRLGIKLFVRGHRSISFTAEGEQFFQVADSALQQLLDGIESIDSLETKNVVAVTASVGVSGLWLLPRLGSFQKHHPEINIRLVASNSAVDLQSDNIDLAIRYASESSPPPDSVFLFGETLVPVAHPSLRLSPIENIVSFQNQVLLEFDDIKSPWLHWENWFRSMNWSDLNPSNIVRFNQYDQVIQAAIDGQGIALGRLELLRPMIDDGRLQLLSTPGQKRHSDYAYWLIQPTGHLRSEVKTVASWILKQAALSK